MHPDVAKTHLVWSFENWIPRRVRNLTILVLASTHVQERRWHSHLAS
jgi:hypothetical protein